MLKKYLTFIAIAILIIAVCLTLKIRFQDAQHHIGRVAVIISDDISTTHPYAQAWQDAAIEEGLKVDIIHASDFLRPEVLNNKEHYVALILPDEIHQSMSSLFIDALREYVEAGGVIMPIYDAGTQNLQHKTLPDQSRLTSLVGIKYATYKTLKDHTLLSGAAVSTPEILTKLNIPPEKYNAIPTKFKNAEMDKARQMTGLDISKEVVLSSYTYDWLEYGYFATTGIPTGKTLMSSETGSILATVNAIEKGKVLFVNLPLTYLKMHTDGALLHGFMHYLTTEILKLPFIGNTPEGVGGLIMNWHVDSSAAIPSLKKMKEIGFFDQGPYSVHFTAGPDLDTLGDKLGLDLEHSVEAQTWVRFFQKRGDAVGSHGGWIHNYFGRHVSEDNEKDFSKYLTLNKQAIEKITQVPITEYSAPLGNQPTWITSWLNSNGIKGYYFTGNIGQGPTRTYRNGKRADDKTWSFPVIVKNTLATFEDAQQAQIPQKEMEKWLINASDFVANHALIRLIYFHPPGAITYAEAAKEWLSHTKKLGEDGQFKWYTMTQIADFLNQRDQVEWTIFKNKPSEATLIAKHSKSLRQQNWHFPKDQYDKPYVIAKQAIVRETSFEWIVVAQDIKELKVLIGLKKEFKN
ncbi:MAG: hypothetical protein V4525_13905 [Pseudomonadota bacterium]